MNSTYFNFSISLICLFLIQSLAFGEASLFFPLEKNGNIALPQRFEYHLIDQDNFRIGDVLIDTRKINIQLQLMAANHIQATFHWPAALLKKGNIVIKDNSGRALWSTNINPTLIITEKSNVTTQLVTNKNETLRTDAALYKVTDIESELIDKIASYPFFKVCYQNTEGPTKIFLCSKDLFITKKNKKIFIRQQESSRTESYVEINGQKVSNQGMVFLQSKLNPISMRALIRSGATIEIDTRLKSIDLKDVFQTEDKKILIQASGATPARDDLIYSQEGSDWTMEVDPQRPVIYIQGECGIPLRQEFILGKYIRPESFSIPIIDDANIMTYNQSTSLRLKTSSGMELEEIDPKSTPQKINETEWKWILTDLKSNQKNRRHVLIKTKQAQYIGAFDISRNAQYELTGQLLYQTQLSLKLHMGLNDTFALGIESNPSATSGQLNYRLTPGPHLLSASHELFISVDSYSLGILNTSGLSVGGMLMYELSSDWKSYFNWAEFNLKIPVLSLSTSPSITGDFISDIILKKKFESWTWELGFRIESLTFKTLSTDTNISRSSLLLGGSIIF